jgi:hypothetical protein
MAQQRERNRMKRINSAIMWQGDSVIDGAPIALIATGISKGSRNEKTGHMVQTYIIRRDMSPMEAVHSGADRAICGDCQHRGEVVNGRNVNRSCYVTVWQGPTSVYKAFKRGAYPNASNFGADLLRSKSVRIGAYGDPAAVPFMVWESLLMHADRGTGYTHQWKWCDKRLARYCMASVDSLEESKAAQAMGYRTFRVGTWAESAVKRQEFLCPASAEAGKVTNCAACLACGGNSSPNHASVFIPAHGVKSKVKAFAERDAA